MAEFPDKNDQKNRPRDSRVIPTWFLKGGVIPTIISRASDSPLFDFKSQDATGALVDALLSDGAILDSSDDGIEGLDEILGA